VHLKSEKNGKLALPQNLVLKEKSKKNPGGGE
jgi:hypothetical protein